MGLKRDSKLVKESQKVLSIIIDQLESESPPAAAEFSVLANIVTGSSSDKREVPSTQPQNANTSAPTSNTKPSSPKKPLQSLRARLSMSAASGKPAKPETPSRRATITNASPLLPQQQVGSPNQIHHSSQSPAPNSNHFASDKHRSADVPTDHNLDYYSLGPDNIRAMSCSDLPKTSMSTADWEFILSDMDRGHSNIFNGIYGGQECIEDRGPFASLVDFQHQHQQASAQRQSSQELSPEAWSASSGDLPNGNTTAPQSVLSYSEESLGSADDVPVPPEVNIQPPNGLDMVDPLKGIMIPAADEEFNDMGLFEGWDHRLVT
ncbi:hypothetical protein VTN96DRAFT_4816 [Rasamsonia emersonii]